MTTLVRLSNLEQFAAVNLTSDPGYIRQKKQMTQVVEISWGINLEGGRTAHVITHGVYSGPFVGSQAIANAIMTGITGHANFTTLRGFLATTTIFAGIGLRDLNVVEQPLISSSAAAVAGTSASPAIPNEVALVGTLQTANAGKQNRGRIYFPGWATNAMGAGNVVAAAAVTAYSNWLAIIAGVYQQSGYTLCVGHLERAGYTSPITGSVFPPRPSGGVPVLGVVVRDNHWDSQRKRGLK